MKSAGWAVFTACLLAPAGASLFRKLVPGQPNFLEIGGIGAVLLGGVWLMLQRRSLPGWVLVPLLVWAYFQLVYASFALAHQWQIGAAAMLIRIGPMLMAGIAFAAIRNGEELRKASYWPGALAVALLPIGLLVAVFGTEIVPYWLQPIQRMAELGRTLRKGVPVVAGVFSTQSSMSMSMLAVMYLSLANAALAETERRSPAAWWTFAGAALALVFLSTRRGAFIAAAIGIVVYVLGRRRVPTRLVLFGGVAIAAAVLFDQAGSLAARRGVGRGVLLLHALDLWYEIPFRVGVVFGPMLAAFALEAPFGTYLGFAGPEADAMLGHRARMARFTFSIFEVGGAQVLAETGIFGAILMPLVVGVLIWQIRRQSVGMRCRQAVNLLLLYQVLLFLLYYMKEESIMTGVSMAQLFFWAVPGICAALIQRERRERKYWRAVWRHHYQGAISRREAHAPR